MNKPSVLIRQNLRLLALHNSRDPENELSEETIEQLKLEIEQAELEIERRFDERRDEK